MLSIKGKVSPNCHTSGQNLSHHSATPLQEIVVVAKKSVQKLKGLPKSYSFLGQTAAYLNILESISTVLLVFQTNAPITHEVKQGIEEILPTF